MQNTTVIQGIEARYTALAPLMDERMRRQWAAAEAEAYGWGGLRAVACATGFPPTTIRKGLVELTMRRSQPTVPVVERLRRPGGGRKRKSETDLGLLPALE